MHLPKKKLILKEHCNSSLLDSSHIHQLLRVGHLLFFFLISAVWSVNGQTRIVGTSTENGGTVFAINDDGSSPSILADFTYGRDPVSGLIETNNKLWGVTPYGGRYDHGIIYTIDLDGSNYTKVHEFDGTNGSGPRAIFVESNGKLWGATFQGGATDDGVLFTINPDGTGFEKVEDFDDANTGHVNKSALIDVNGELWGIASHGGANGYGVIYTIDNDGMNFSTEHDFGTDGSYPMGGLTLANNKLWGTAPYDVGTSGDGIIYSINTDGTGFTEIHDFSETDGEYPYGTLLESNGKLWGITKFGGSSGNGTIFNLNTDGTGFTKIHDFDGIDSRYPVGGVIESNGKLWGFAGGGFAGTIYSIDPDGTNFTIWYEFDESAGPQGPTDILYESNNKLWGTASAGGFKHQGMIFSIENDGSNVETHHDFFSNDFGLEPSSNPTLNCGKLYGTTIWGGSNNSGTIYSVNRDGTDLTKIFDFDHDVGANPYGSLLISNGRLWGMTYSRGPSSGGTVYSLNLDGSNFILHHDIVTAVNGSTSSPFGSFIEYDNKLFGMLRAGIISMNTDGTELEMFYRFESGTGTTYGDLTFSNGKFWGMTETGGTNFNGVIFSIDPDGSNFSIVHEFDDTNGKRPQSSLLSYNGKLWGMTRYGGIYGLGTVFSIDNNGNNFTKHYDFDDTNGKFPRGDLIAHNGKFWGMTESGGTSEGTYNNGVIFTMNLDGTGFSKVVDLTNGDHGGNPLYGSLLVVEDKLNQDITFTPSNKAYGDNEYLLSASSTSPNNISYYSSDESILSITNNSASILGAGEVSITAFQNSDGSYYSGCAVSNVSIAKAPLTATPDNQLITYGEELPELTISYDDFVYDDTESDISPPNAQVNYSGVGMFDIVLSGGSANNYELELGTGTLTVNKAALIASADDKEYTYGGNIPDFTISYDGFVNNETESEITPPTANVSNDGSAGTYDIILSGGSADNYDLTLENGTLTISKANLTITADDKTITEGETIPTLTMSFDAFVNDDTEADITLPSISTDATSSSPIGVYDIILSGGSADNYDLTLIDGTLSIEAALGLYDNPKVISIYPNPAKSEFSILDEETPSEVFLVGQDGKVIKSYNTSSGNNYSVLGIPEGLYIVMAKIYSEWKIARLNIK